ncbi:transporter [Brevundimonas sp.]|jgi:hypothetical protein|uniref:transporter n=1 Tax=Brevundimonas sp. TaxID=1871086 RepID=UPI00391AE9EE
MKLGIGALALVASLVASGAWAQDGERRPFCPDRPGKGDSTCVIDPGVVQVEVGLFDGFEQEDDATRIEGWSVGSVTVRYGIGPRTEVQAGVSIATREEATDRATGVTDKAEGISDLFLAMRHSLINPDGEPFGLALTLFGTVPTGGDEVRASGIEAGIALPMAFDTGTEWSLGVSPFVEAIRDADGEGSHAAYSLVVGTDRGFGDWTLGAEIWISLDDDPLGSTTQSTFDLIAVWSPPSMPDAQLDFGLNFGLNDDSPDVEFGVGLARRF